MIELLCNINGCNGELEYIDDEYGSLAEGGSYEVYECIECGNLVYFSLPD